jgi:hypothetical protein
MRKEVRITLKDAGKDLTFVIRQMPASKLEWWIFRAIQVLGPALEVPQEEGIEGIGKALADKGFAALSNIDPEKAKPLLDEMLATASRVLDSGATMEVDINSVDGYITDIVTLFKLRIECFKVNLSFFGNGSLSGFQPEEVSQQSASKPIRIASR